MHTTHPTTRATKLRRAALLALPILTLALGACTKTTYTAASNTVEVTMAGGVNCADQVNLTNCTNMREVAWATDSVKVTDGLGRSQTVAGAALGLACGFGASRPCAPTEVLTKQLTLGWTPCGAITTTVRYARMPFAGADVPNYVTDTSTTSSGRGCPSNAFSSTPA